MAKLDRDGVSLYYEVHGERPPLLRDSRLVTVYGQVLQNDAAHKVLRKHRNLDVARQIVEMAELPIRIGDLRSRVLIARDEVELADWSQELDHASDALFKASRALRRAVQDLLDDQQ